jgi:hypothetical protein
MYTGITWTEYRLTFGREILLLGATRPYKYEIEAMFLTAAFLTVDI